MSLIHGRGTKQFQDFFTPAAISQQLADRIMADWRAAGETDVTVLDPAVGSGSLIWPLLAEWEHGLVVLCCDIQQDYLEAVRAKCLALGYKCELVPTGLRITK
jgi:predicted RNA methylase